MMRGTYGTVEDEDEDDVERQRHLSSERNFVPRDAFSSVAKTRKHYERKQKHHRDARGDAFCRRRGLARGRPKDERKNFARERRRCFCGVGIIISFLGPRRRTSNSGEILGFTPSKTVHGVQQRGGGKDEEDEYDDEKPSIVLAFEQQQQQQQKGGGGATIDPPGFWKR